MNSTNKSWFTQPRTTLKWVVMFFVLSHFIMPLASIAQTFDKGFELVSGSLPTLTDDMNNDGTNDSYKVSDTGGYTASSNLSPFAVWGNGQGGYLVNSQFNAHSGSNFLMLSGDDNCFGLLSACSFSDAKTYKITFWAAAWAPSGTTGSLSPSLDIKREPGVSNTMWVVGTTQGQSIVNSYYSGATTGSEATWAASTSNYFSLGTGWNALPISNSTTLTWTKYEYTFTNVGGLTKIWISKFGGVDGYLCIDDITCEEVCTKPNAGTDQAPTCVGNTPITTATLAATAVTGGAWTQLGTTPNTATITDASSATSTVTGLIPGEYQFIWATSATCSDTVKITIPSCVVTCPTIVQSADTTVCAGSIITLRADLTGITTEDIKFVYFNTHQTDATIIYATPDGVLGTVTNAQLTAGKTKAALSTTIPASPASTTYHVYAILSPTPADANCRPYGHRHVITDPSKCPCSLPECLGVAVTKN